ncbi:Ribosomal RNA small subunit methyltransferase E 1 [Porphyridium purpureum]|uniref:16S rRNA (uracil(1498)-N(3))-methyltransferase n=1 Tax=Porphyridium purpureum TaxID=35688 RepID=A0A5J4Z539_PORPP|nr:Ribosomal RNA small subunit methyltransferase E 1 [Porphyridium purpureum]|eukprot:POR0175..scf295_1
MNAIAFGCSSQTWCTVRARHETRIRVRTCASGNARVGEGSNDRKAAQDLSFRIRASRLDTPSKEILRRRRLRDGGHRNELLMLNRILVELDFLDVRCNGGDVASRQSMFTLPRDDFRSEHVRQVLGLGDGELLRAGCVDGSLFDAQVQWNANGSMSLIPIVLDAAGRPQKNWNHRDLLTPCTPTRVPLRPLRIDVMLAVPRPKVLLRILNHLAVMGVGNIVLCNAYKVEKSYLNSKSVRDAELLRAELLAGVCQSAVDSRLPKVHFAPRLRAFLEDDLPSISTPGQLRVVAHPPDERTSASFSSLSKLIIHGSDLSASVPPERVLLAIGPEGGWMPREISMMCSEQHGFVPVAIGERVLRTEQACLSLVAITQELLQCVHG